MTQRAWLVAFVILAAYTAALFGVEAATSHAYARQFFADIDEDVPFFAINTTLSVSLQWAAALLFVVCAEIAGPADGGRERRLFYWLQAAIFAYSGFDDQYQVHEKLSWRLGIGDHWILLGAVSAELTLLATLGRRVLAPEAWTALRVTGVLFVFMLAIDVVAPQRMYLRLSTEDLAKSWAAFFLVRYGWAMLRRELAALRDQRTGDVPERTLRLVAAR